jgi:hypothetical protein
VEIERLSSNEIPPLEVRQARGDAAVAVAREALPGADIAFINRFGLAISEDQITSVETFAQQQASGLDPVDGATFYRDRLFLGPTPTKIRIYAGATVAGTFRLHLSGGSSVIRTFNGATYARFVALHEVAHYLGFSGVEANNYVLERLR